MYNFIYSSSDIYAPYCLTSMSSLLKNNPNLSECRFYVLSNNISSAMRDRMKSLCGSYQAELHVVDCNLVIDSIFVGGVH